VRIEFVKEHLAFTGEDSPMAQGDRIITTMPPPL
jgi:hypothetical protein